MTYDDEDEEPTNPGIGSPLRLVPLHTATVERADDPNQRPTVRAPAPERLDPTPRAVQLAPALPKVETEVVHTAPAVVTSTSATATIIVDADDRDTIPLHEHEMETWRPPPPIPAQAKTAGARTTTAVAATNPKPSSIAPQELVRGEAAPRSPAPLIALAMLAVLGAGALWRANSMRQGAAAEAGSDATPEPVAVATAPVAPPAPMAPIAPPKAVEPEIAKPIEAAPAPTPVAPEAAPLTAVDRARPRIAARGPKPSPVAITDLPEQPSRKAIGDAITAIRSDLGLCAEGKPGVAELDLTLNGSGSVSHAIVGGDFAGTPQGSCIARTLRRAQFAPFEQAKFRVLYRLML